VLADGRLGMKTQQVVCAFQQRMGLVMTGVVDQKQQQYWGCHWEALPRAR